VHPDVSGAVYGVFGGRIERNLLMTEVKFRDAKCSRKHDDKEPTTFQLAVLRIGVLLTVVPCIQDVAA
jgi:hypothetical protein